MAVAVGGAQKFFVEHIGAHECELWLVFATIVLQEVAVHHNLVEEVPRSTVSECTDAFSQLFPEWVVDVVHSLHVLRVWHCLQHFGATLVHWVVVQVAHVDDALVGVVGEQRVDGAARHCSGSLTQITALFFATEA